MGMFDYIKWEAPLPETDVPPPESIFQTKDFPEPYLHAYRVTKAGALKFSPHGDDDETFAPHDGVVDFYTGNHPDVGWWEYRASFRDGHLQQVTLVEFRKPEGRDRNAEIEAERRAALAQEDTHD